jgi:hypothetical protein
LGNKSITGFFANFHKPGNHLSASPVINGTQKKSCRRTRETVLAKQRVEKETVFSGKGISFRDKPKGVKIRGNTTL